MKPSKDNSAPMEITAASLSESYRRFARAIGSFSDFQGFCHSLTDAVAADPYLRGSFLIEDELNVDDESSARVFEQGRVVLPMSGSAAGGFLRVSGRKDQRPFGAEDLRLMGSMADFVAALYGRAKEQRRVEDKVKVLQFLIDQLPLGVLCFDATGELMSGNLLAWKQLGLAGEPQQPEQCEVLLALKECVNNGAEAHFEVQGRFLFAARRSFDPGTGVVSAYVIYDLSNRRSKLLGALEREYYRGKYRDAPVSVALLESKQQAGALYASLKHSELSVELGSDLVQPLDAYLCVCVFPGQTLSQVRRKLGSSLGDIQFEDLKLALFQPEHEESGQSWAELLDSACLGLERADLAMRPNLLVLDAYEPIADSLSVLLEDAADVMYCADVGEAVDLIELGGVDCLLFDLDRFGAEALEEVRALLRVTLGSVQLAYSSARSKRMWCADGSLSERDLLIQKPFDAMAVARALKLKFNLA